MKHLITILLLFSLPHALAEKSEYQAWKDGRLERLMEPNGWLSLVALDWLHRGDNRVGSASNNDIILAGAPEHIGNFYLDSNDHITFSPQANVAITADDMLLSERIDVLSDSADEGPTLFKLGTFEFYVIERDKFALRVKNSAAKTRTGFKGLEYFPEDVSYRVTAQFVPYEPAKIIPTVNVWGIQTDAESPGRLEFELNGERFSLDALNSSDAYYMIFADKTNGHSTYGPGRFLYTDSKVDENGEVVIDFNKAYNPPCAFTPYSTCTLPPPQNRMRTLVQAGEKKYADSQY